MIDSDKFSSSEQSLSSSHSVISNFKEKSENGSLKNFSNFAENSFNQELPSDLISLRTLRRVSLESLEGYKNNDAFKPERSLSRKLSPEVMCSQNYMEKKQGKDCRYLESLIVRPGTQSFQTIELGLSNLCLKTIKPLEVEKEKIEQEEPTVSAGPYVLYEGEINMSINDVEGFDFIGKIYVIRKKQDRILVIKSQQVKTQKIKISREDQKKLKRTGNLHCEDISIWQYHTQQWMPCCSIDLFLVNFKNKKEQK